MNGCLSASVGVHLFSGFRFKHFSNKSTNRFNSFISASAAVVEAITLVLISRVGFVIFRVLITSYNKKKEKETQLAPSHKPKEEASPQEDIKSEGGGEKTNLSGNFVLLD